MGFFAKLRAKGVAIVKAQAAKPRTTQQELAAGRLSDQDLALRQADLGNKPAREALEKQLGKDTVKEIHRVVTIEQARRRIGTPQILPLAPPPAPRPPPARPAVLPTSTERPGSAASVARAGIDFGNLRIWLVVGGLATAAGVAFVVTR